MSAMNPRIIKTNACCIWFQFSITTFWLHDFVFECGRQLGVEGCKCIQKVDPWARIWKKVLREMWYEKLLIWSPDSLFRVSLLQFATRNGGTAIDFHARFGLGHAGFHQFQACSQETLTALLNVNRLEASLRKAKEAEQIQPERYACHYQATCVHPSPTKSSSCNVYMGIG